MDRKPSTERFENRWGGSAGCKDPREVVQAEPVPGVVSGDDRARTGNLRLAKPALSQLSYVPVVGPR